MATRQVLAELVQQFQQQSGQPVAVESVGGVDAARRVQAGEAFDAVILASDAIDRLLQAGKVLAGSRTDLVRSATAVAVRAGSPHPDIGSEAALKAAVLAARSLSHSTGPSGVALLQLFERWGIAGQVRDRIVQAPPGVPVGSLVARGEVELGFQQLSELIHLPGIEVVGLMPAEVEITTVFSGAIAATCAQPEAVRALLHFLASPAAEGAKRRNGMEPA